MLATLKTSGIYRMSSARALDGYLLGLVRNEDQRNALAGSDPFA